MGVRQENLGFENTFARVVDANRRMEVLTSPSSSFPLVVSTSGIPVSFVLVGFVDMFLDEGCTFAFSDLGLILP